MAPPPRGRKMWFFDLTEIIENLPQRIEFVVTILNISEKYAQTAELWPKQFPWDPLPKTHEKFVISTSVQADLTKR